MFRAPNRIFVKTLKLKTETQVFQRSLVASATKLTVLRDNGPHEDLWGFEGVSADSRIWASVHGSLGPCLGFRV